jgi:hypothetical protein
VSDPDPASSYWPIPFAMTPAGEKAIDDLKNFFKVGEQWVDSPGTYQQK